VRSSSTQLGSAALFSDADDGMVNLKDLLVNNFGLDLSGWILEIATGISGDGLTIVGWGTNPDAYTEAWIAIIPEPAMVLLLGFSAVFSRRRR